MLKRLLSLLGIGLAAGCGNNGTQQGRPRTDQLSGVEVQLGGSDPDEPRCLPFKILEVYEGRSPSTRAPYHVDGGDWTYLDCQTTSDPPAVFTIGLLTKRDDAGALSVWGKAFLVVSDRCEAERFIESFDEHFAGTSPTPTKRDFSPAPFLMTTTVLGENLNREAIAFSGEGGGWTATKWFPVHDGREAEVYFNYNVGAKEGEFREKDSDYGDDLLAIWASALRDGPRPERTPENDPTLTNICPTIGLPRKLLSRFTAHYSFDPTGNFAVFEGGTTILALPLAVSDSEVSEIAHLDHSPWEVRVLNGNLDLIVQEGIPEKPGAKSSSDPMRIWWVGGQRKEKTLLRGPEKELGLAESPDLRFVGLHQWRGHPRTNDRRRVLIILDRESRAEKIFDSTGGDLSLVGWKQTPTGFQAVTVGRLARSQSKTTYLADPRTGSLEPVEADVEADFDRRLSPDRRQRFGVDGDHLVITDLPTDTERRFKFHDDDQEYLGEDCVAWVNERYLKFNGPRLALIDVTMLKMCFPLCADGSRFPSYSYVFSPDFRWVLYEGEAADGEGLFLAPVRPPMQPAQE